MARIKLPLPQVDAVHTCTQVVRITDLNYGNHLGNQVILEYCHEARVQYFQNIGQSEMNFLDLGLIMADSVINYKSEGFWGDEILISTYVTETHARGFDLFYHMKTPDNKEIARVKTGMVFFNYKTRKLAKSPENLMSTLFN